MPLALQITAIVILALLLAYRINFLIYKVKDSLPKKSYKIFKQPIGIICSVIYAGILSILVFLLKLPGMYIMWIDLILFLLIASYIDFKCRIIPNSFTVSLLITQSLCIYSLAEGTIGFLNFLITLLLTLLMVVLSKLNIEQIGIGDIKLFIVVNMIYGLSYLMYTMIFAMVIIIFVSIPLLIMKKITLKSGFPFVPFYLFGNIIYIIFNILM